MSSRAGYVLTGGKSSRMGRDKAALPYHGQILSEVVAGAVRGAAGRVTLVGGSPAVEGRWIPDLYPGEGPLGGILSALRDSPAEWNLIVACDMPGLEREFLAQLLQRAEDCDGDALVPVGPSGRMEPLCAAYSGRCLQPFAAAFDRGIRKIALALAEVRTVTWPVSEVSYFQNVNTPEEWAAYVR